MATVRLRVNEADRDVEAPADATLLDVLRDRLGLTGARFGCGEEECGACMVLVDGAPAFACTRPLDTLDGCSVETVEGLAEDDPVLAALVQRQAAQCAYCLPGIVMSAKALLTRSPNPDRAQVLAALQPHLCRCGAHGRIVEAILSVRAA